MLYIDTSNPIEIEKYKSLGIIGGVTTNQKILLQDKQTDIKEAIQKILKVSGTLPVNVELTNTSGTDDELVFEAHEYYDLSRDNIIIKVPMWSDGRGLRIAKLLRSKSIPVNITCCMSIEQVILAASANVEFVSLFFRRIVDYIASQGFDSDAHKNACDVIAASSRFLNEGGYDTQLIVGSIRKPEDVSIGLVNEADIVTVPPLILEKMFKHPKTDETIAEFDEAWKKLQTVK